MSLIVFVTATEEYDETTAGRNLKRFEKEKKKLFFFSGSVFSSHGFADRHSDHCLERRQFRIHIFKCTLQKIQKHKVSHKNSILIYSQCQRIESCKWLRQVLFIPFQFKNSNKHFSWASNSSNSGASETL